ncbi:glutamate synthase domain-containing protein 2 [Methanococcus voltae]|uniref:Archaeal glutamate synthase [NADPH] n=1 Tax=Methanococcus voltae TaxID=2188 RepID=A0A8J7REP4_METVO|nr:glutamate synthase-related protein [Methanococcus voltae]MBP2144316.1 glutamate synthase domain-containing protein 2 [Methanococcus voltae]MBP2201857.1 glutamate synthase domain-containing protein 2 [Methanococcus voltae]
MIPSTVPPKYKITIDHDKCILCGRCAKECAWDAIRKSKDKIITYDNRCGSCFRCASMCPRDAITIIENPSQGRKHPVWTPEARQDVLNQANSGCILLSGMGNAKDYPIYYDNIVLDACQVTNPSIDPLREPMELRTYIGSKPEKLEFEYVEEEIDGKKVKKSKLKTKIAPNLKLDTPIMIGHMSYGAISLNSHKAMAKAVKRCGTFMGTGEGGLHRDLYEYSDNIITQVASGRFGVNSEYLSKGAAIEIKIGQGAKPGIGGHLPGEKVSAEVSMTRMIPEGSDAISPAPHHDIYSIEDLAQLVRSLKEATRWKLPVFVKISAVHNVAAIANGIATSDADAVVIDGFKGGTGAAPKVFRDNVGIPIEVAISAVDDRLREQGNRNKVSIIASGGIRNSADVFKSIALGADAVYIGTAAMIAMGCTVCGRCYGGKCCWGIATQRADLVERLEIEEAADRVSNLIGAWTHEIKELLGAAGINSIESLRGNRDRLRGIGLNEVELKALGLKQAGL